MNIESKQQHVYIIYYFANCLSTEDCMFVFDAMNKKEITNIKELKRILEAIKNKKYKRISIARTQNASKIKLII